MVPQPVWPQQVPWLQKNPQINLKEGKNETRELGTVLQHTFKSFNK